MKVKDTLGQLLVRGVQKGISDHESKRIGSQIKVTDKIAKFYPQATYCVFTSGFRQKFNYVIQTIPHMNHLMQPLESVIQQEFITSLSEGRTCNDEERQLLSLPVKLGGMGKTNITSISDIEYQTSTKNLVDKIKN